MSTPTDPRTALLGWLRLASAAYGDDLPIAVDLPALAAPSVAPTAPPSASLAAPVARRTPPISTPSGSRPQPKVAAPPPPSPVDDGIELPADLEALRRVVTPCRRCKLCDHRTQTVFGEGSPNARVLFVGEAPGAREDEEGRPFVGPAGRLLTRIIENAMGLTRADVYIANVNKCRPPNNRNPEPDEIAACLPFLKAQIRAIRPEVIVTLGRVATQNLLGTALPMAQLRRQDLSYDGVPVVATWHPAYLLRQPTAKRDTWEDVKRVNAMLGLPPVPRSPRPPG